MDALSVENIKKDYSFYLSKHTTYGLGGKVNCAYFPENTEETITCFQYLKDTDEKFFVLGKGSNILASDEGFAGSVISTNNLKKIEREGETLYCEAGVTVVKLMAYCIEHGITGLEYLAGIPASVGGLTFMNGGIASAKISNNIIEVTIFDGETKVLPNEKCAFSNKHSIMRDIDCVILGVKLKIEQSTPQTVKENIKRFTQRRIKLPVGKSCGCVFKNPEGYPSAGAIIEDCGLKGLSCGSAVVSDVHANFVLNCGNSAKDVYNLIKTVKERVLVQKHILLDEEVVYIGDF